MPLLLAQQRQAELGRAVALAEAKRVLAQEFGRALPTLLNR